MSNNNKIILQTIMRELDTINEKIDKKIIKGQDYKKEAVRHMFLLSQYRNLAQPNRSSNWLHNIARTVSTFMF